MLRGLFGGGSREKGLLSQLPARGASVEVIAAGRPSRTAIIDESTVKGLVIGEVLGRPGESAVVIFSLPTGKFRFGTRITAVKENATTLEIPRKIDRVGASLGEHRRATVRLDALVPGKWRFAPGGKGTGEFSRGNIRDISRGGCSLIADRAMKTGTLVEVQLQLRTGAADLTFLGEVMRTQEIASSGKVSHGLRFHGVTPEEDRAIIEFINRKQSELRSRGLA